MLGRTGSLDSSALWVSEFLLNILYSFRAQDPPCCGMLGMDQSPDTERMSELLERSSSPDGKPQGTLSFSVWARCPLTLKRLALLLKRLPCLCPESSNSWLSHLCPC